MIQAIPIPPCHKLSTEQRGEHCVPVPTEVCSVTEAIYSLNEEITTNAQAALHDDDISKEVKEEAEVAAQHEIVGESSKVGINDLDTDKPTQPILKDFPVKFINNTKRKFKPAWFTGRPWLEYSITRDSCFCFACRLFSQGSERDRDPAFVSKGFSNWKTALEDGRGFQQHAFSKGHTDAMACWIEFNAKRDGATIAHKLAGEQIAKNRYYVKSIAEVIKFLAINELSFRGDNEHFDGTIFQSSDSSDEQSANVGGLFLKLFEYTLLKDPKLRQIASAIPQNAKYTSPEIQNEIILAMASLLQANIIREFQDSDIKKFCLKCDETRDRSNVENLSLVLRYVRNGIATERLLAMIELGDVDARAITTSILDELQRHNIDKNSIMSQCYDGASVMSGARGGVQKFVQEAVGRFVPYVHCYNHQIHLVIIHTMNKEMKAKNFFSICEQLYVFLRRQLPSSLYEGTTVKRLLEQRWTGHLDCATIVLQNRTKIIEALDAIANSSRAAADLSVEAAGLKSKVSKPEFAVMCEFVVRILETLKPSNKMLQGQSCNMSAAMNLIQSEIATLEVMRNDETFEDIVRKAGIGSSPVSVTSSEPAQSVDDMVSLVSDHQDLNPPKVKRARIQSKLLKDTLVTSTLGQDSWEIRPLVQMKQVFFGLLDNVTGELKARFCNKNIQLVNAVSALTPSSSVFLDNETVQPLIDLAQLGISTTLGELAVAKRFIEQKLSKEATLQDVINFLVPFKDAFPLTYHLYCAGLTIGVSSATCESTFSTLNRVLIPHRQSMTHARKAALVILAFEKQMTNDIDLDKLINNFAKNTRRLQL